jgi:hypothetical protein
MAHALIVTGAALVMAALIIMVVKIVEWLDQD